MIETLLDVDLEFPQKRKFLKSLKTASLEAFISLEKPDYKDKLNFMPEDSEMPVDDPEIEELSGDVLDAKIDKKKKKTKLEDNEEV